MSIEDTESRTAEGALHEYIAALEARIVALEARVSPPPPAASVAQPIDRRTLISAGAAGVVAAATGFVLAKPRIALADDGRPLLQYMDFSCAPTDPTCAGVSPSPLDTAVRWMRKDPAGKPPFYTNEIVSLIADATQTNSFTWPLYIELRATTSPAATQNTSQSVGATVRTFNRSTGSPWMAGFHSEAYHGRDWNSSTPLTARGTTLLFNGELTAFSPSGTTIGLNLQNTTDSTQLGTHAINIQSAGRPDGSVGRLVQWHQLRGWTGDRRQHRHQHGRRPLQHGP